MRTQAEVVESIKKCFPLAFANDDSMDRSRLQLQIEEVTEYAIKATQAFLSSETVRYQSILLYSALVLASLRALRQDKFKFGEIVVVVDSRLLAFYTLFICSIATIFLTKVYVDYQRAKLARSKNGGVVEALQHSINIGIIRTRIQIHFWSKLAAAIDDAYRSYLALKPHLRDLGPEKAWETIQVDLDKLRELPEVANEIRELEERFSELTSSLSLDEAEFKLRSNNILARVEDGGDDSLLNPKFRSEHEITEAYELCLQPWLEARIELSRSKNQSSRFETENNVMDHLIDVLGRITRVRRLYAFLEVSLPLLSALLAIAYVWMNQTPPAHA